MSANVGKNHGTWNQPKNVEEKSLERTSLFIVKSKEKTKKLD